VHRLLRRLEAIGYSHLPRVLGLDHDHDGAAHADPRHSGRETWAKIVPEEGLRAFARLLRGDHDAVADFRPSRSPGAGPGPG
jgi:hypothetical protein